MGVGIAGGLGPYRERLVQTSTLIHFHDAVVLLGVRPRWSDVTHVSAGAGDGAADVFPTTGYRVNGLQLVILACFRVEGHLGGGPPVFF
jgi:hypothetical protein